MSFEFTPTEDGPALASAEALQSIAVDARRIADAVEDMNVATDGDESDDEGPTLATDGGRDDDDGDDVDTNDDTDDGELFEELAAEGRVAIDPHPARGNIPAGHTGVLGAYDDGDDVREIRVSGPPTSASKRGRDFTRTWRVETERGTFDVAYSIDRTPGNRTHTVVVSRVGDVAGEGGA